MSLKGEAKRKNIRIETSQFALGVDGAGSLDMRAASKMNSAPKIGFLLERSQRLISLGSDIYCAPNEAEDARGDRNCSNIWW